MSFISLQLQLHITFSPLILMALLISLIIILTLIWLTSLLMKMFSKKEQRMSLPPGPMGLPIIGSLPFLHPELHTYFTFLSKSYGPIFSLRLGNKIVVVISTPSLAQEVLKDKDTIFANRDVTIAGKVGFYGGSDILWSPYGPEWRMLRKIFVQEMLRGPMVDFFNEIRQREVRKIVNSLWVRRMSPVDVGEEVFMTVLNSITTVLWGDEMAEKSLGTEFRPFVEEINILLGTPNISDLIPCLSYFDLQGIERKMKRLVKRFDKYFDWIIDERMREDDNNEKKDFLQVLLNLRKGAGDNKTPLTVTHLKSLLLDMVLGGADSTSNMVKFALAEMMNYPHVMKKAQKELEVVVGIDNMVEESHLKILPYLYAIMKETLRLHPGVPLLSSRCPTETSIVGGYTIPKGARVFINVWSIHRDPSIWEDPLKFDPERFMSSKWDYSGKDLNYFPFGSGRRICPGIQLGEKMFLILLASLIHSFEWKVSQGEKVDLEEKFGLVLNKKNPLMAIPIPRLSNQAVYM
ncbi:flavonoid 3'-monooxygenase CYP75B137-like [Impatiens glandulifera]|uniref:flavonoid 3'-monooxygenase CYP75B137-like n=1 Tax=Impatiens glandulifera TaxID=253017 RepID=UPI001FB11E87|nr:flavonoid 3'-monooxygenase CYP75B137-like [Impatiens glandulifera]